MNRENREGSLEKYRSNAAVRAIAKKAATQIRLGIWDSKKDRLDKLTEFAYKVYESAKDRYEQMYQQKLSRKRIAYFEIEQDGRLRMVNEACKKMFGYGDISNRDVKKYNVFDLINPEDHQRLRDNMKMIVDGDIESTNNTYRCIRKDRSEFFVRVYSYPVYNTDVAGFKTLDHIGGDMIDVTYDKVSEVYPKALFDFANTLDAIEDGEDAIIISLNKLMVQAKADQAYYADFDDEYRFDANKTKDKYDDELIIHIGRKSFREKVVKELLIDLQSGKPINDSVENFPPLAREFFIKKGVKTALMLPVMVDNKFVGVIGLNRTKSKNIFLDEEVWILRYISTTFSEHLKRLYMKKMTAKQENIYRNIYTESNFLMVKLDLEGNVEDMNIMAQKVTGYGKHEIKGKNFFRLITPREQYSKTEKIFNAFIDEDYALNQGVLTVIPKKGKTTEVLFSNTPLTDEKGVRKGLMLVGFLQRMREVHEENFSIMVISADLEHGKKIQDFVLDKKGGIHKQISEIDRGLKIAKNNSFDIVMIDSDVLNTNEKQEDVETMESKINELDKKISQLWNREEVPYIIVVGVQDTDIKSAKIERFFPNKFSEIDEIGLELYISEHITMNKIRGKYQSSFL